MILLPPGRECDILEAVLVILFILASITAVPQPVGDGVKLLRQVSEAARLATGWRAEETITFGGNVSVPVTESARGSLEMRDSLFPAVCGGFVKWKRFSLDARGSISSRGFGESFEKATAEECNPIAFRWGHLLDSLRSATLVGKDSMSGCTLVSAEYERTSDFVELVWAVGPVHREMCVNRDRKAVLSERFEGASGYGLFVLNFPKIERDPESAPVSSKSPIVSS
ncbi:MAG TPA: hypothetical protein VGG72_32160 [Bryobacteraceae bacterium]|jgi:hypothetical protein